MKCNLSGALTMYQAVEARGELLRALAGEGPFELDTRAVLEVDATGLQVLLAALKSAAAKGQVIFPVSARGQAVATGLGLLGLAERDWNQPG